MYTRSRQSQNFTGGTPQRNQGGGNPGAQQYQGQPAYKQQGNYQGGNQNQLDAIKQGNSTPYKQQPQQPQQPQMPQQQRVPNTPQTPQQPRVPNAPQTPQQSQQPQQPQTPQQPQQQRVQNTPQIKQQQPPTPQPQRLKPILKSSTNVQTPSQVQISQNQNQNQNQQNVQSQQPNNGMETTEPVESIDGDSQELPKWRRKTPGLKVSRKLKRLRMNQRLRKTLQPKNAIMVLNEMKTGVQFTFPESQSILPNSLFLVHAEIDGKTYVGQGISKPLARQNAAENALKSLLLEKMTAAASKARLDAETEAAAIATDGENKEGVESMETTEESDDIPWSSLASFALYKLFLEWQNQGTVVPVPRPGVSPGKVKKESSKPVVQKELPVNAITIHPVMLLNQMRPGLTYSEVSRVGNPPNITFTLACEIDGQEYSGCAKNKKDAKKLAAKNALLALYDLTYPEEKEEDVSMG